MSASTALAAPSASAELRLAEWIQGLKDMRSAHYGHTFQWQHVIQATQDPVTVQRINDMLAASMQAQVERVRKRGELELAQQLEESMKKQMEERKADGIPASSSLLRVESYAVDTYVMEEKRLSGMPQSTRWHAPGNGLCYQISESLKMIRIRKEGAVRDGRAPPSLPFADFPDVFEASYSWSQVAGDEAAGQGQRMLHLKAAHRNSDLHFLIDVNEDSRMPVKITGMREGRMFYEWKATGLIKSGSRLFPQEITVRAMYSYRDVPDVVNVWTLQSVEPNSRTKLPLLPYLDPAFQISDETVSPAVIKPVTRFLRERMKD
ncbi:MAG: hypothetical protein ACO1TE_00620 [Prosthecobacter sp.]